MKPNSVAPNTTPDTDADDLVSYSPATTGKPLARRSPGRIVAGAITTTLLASAAIFYYAFRLQSIPPNAGTADTSVTIAAPTGISALGYLQPEGEIINLSAPRSPNGAGSRIAHLLVKEGDRVEQGEVVAVLDSFESLDAAVRQAEERVAIARVGRAQVEAGAKSGELNAQRAAIAQVQNDLKGQIAAQNQSLIQLKAKLANAQVERDRYQKLFSQGAVTASQLDTKQLDYITAQEQLNQALVERSRIQATLQAKISQAQATFNQVAEIRPTDRQAAEADIQSALADVAKAKADLDLGYVSAPVAGEVLSIHSRPGEVAGNQGILALGQTQQMNVIAEVYELDISRIQVGQPATITSSALSTELQGAVVQIGSLVNPQNVMSTDPVENVDQRIVEVKIQLDPASSQQAAALTNLQVNVVISGQ